MVKRFKIIGVIFCILSILGVFAGYWYQIRSYQKRLVNVRVKYWEQRAQDSTALVVKAEVNKELRDLYLSSIKMSAHWKNEYFKILGAKQETLYVGSTERYEVSFYEERECVKVGGYTLTNPPEAFIDIINIPDILYIDLGYVDEDWVVGRVKSERGCIVFDDIIIEIPPDLNIDNIRKGPGKLKIIGSFLFGATLSWLIFN